MTANDIEGKLRSHFSNFDYLLSNIFFFGQWESDFICRSNSEYWYEVEIKISRSDFKADFKKTEKYHRFSRAKEELITLPGQEKQVWDKETCKYKTIGNYVRVINNKIPNRFYYACPEGMIKKNEVPDYAGLIYCKEGDNGFVGLKQVKASKFLHKRKDDYSKLLLHKYYHRFLSLKHDVEMLKYENQRMREFYKYPGPSEDDPEEMSLW